jgi:hypothetical protein
MWCGTLRSDDLQQATADLRSQRAAIRARFDSEMKQLETKIGDLESLEHSVLNFVSNYNVEDGSSVTVAHPGPVAATVAHPRPAVEKVAGEIASEQSSLTSSETPDARPNIALLNPGDPSGVWTPTERALLSRKQA